MKTSCYILPFCQTAFLGLLIILCFSCETKQEPTEIYKSSPVRKIPEEKDPKEDILKKELFPLPSEDSLSLPDSTGTFIKPDTTETLQRNLKPDIRHFKRIYIHNLHKKILIA